MQNYPELFEETSDKKKDSSEEEEPLKEEVKVEEASPSPPPDSEKWFRDFYLRLWHLWTHFCLQKILLVPDLLVLGTKSYTQILMLFNQPISGFDYR